MNEAEMKQLFDIIFMMVISFVMAIALAYGMDYIRVRLSCGNSIENLKY